MEPGKRILRCARTRPDWPLPGPAQMEVRLTIIGGKADRSEVRLQLPFFIGRSREADLTIAHPMVSRKHCEVFEFQGMVRVRDLGSLNGTTVLGQTVAESPLRPEDEFTVGPLTFRIDYDYGGDVTVEVASGNVAAAASPEQGQRTVDPGKTPTIPAPLRTAVWVPPANGPVEVTVAPVAAPGGHVAAPAPSEATPPGESPKGEALGLTTAPPSLFPESPPPDFSTWKSPAPAKARGVVPPVGGPAGQDLSAEPIVLDFLPEPGDSAHVPISLSASTASTRAASPRPPNAQPGQTPAPASASPHDDLDDFLNSLQ
jgi:predicted component of type VI protein secretion system